MIPSHKPNTWLMVLLFFLICAGSAQAGQTGKIAGQVIDAATGEPLPGANIYLEGTSMGAAADMKGEFYILNIPPGTYTVIATMMGYQQMRMADVRVFVDRTTRVNFELKETAVEGEQVTIVAKQSLVQKDFTATSSSVSSDEIELMPVEHFEDILQLQAGIVEDTQGKLHIRGGRSEEIAYMVDGVSVSDPYSGRMAVSVDQGSIQELKVISGTFNAEYGKVMSGIVEIVTKDPQKKLEGTGTFYLGDYLSSHNVLFPYIDNVEPFALTNIQANITGPVPYLKERMGFYASFRRFHNEGWLYGKRRFQPTDSSNFQSPDAIYMEQTGDDSYVSMNSTDKYYGNFKLVYKPGSSVKLNYNFLGNFSHYRNYNHLFKYNPEGDVTNKEYGYTHMIMLNHMLDPSTFYTVKLSRYHFNYKSYLYEEPDDPRYANPVLLMNREDAYSFLTGGTNMTHFYRTTTVNLGKIDFTSQITKIHQIKSGIEIKHNTLTMRAQSATYKDAEGGGIFDAAAFFNKGEYTHHPVEAAAYVQDKIELENMTLNVGLRYDYFHSNGSVPVDLRDPGNEQSQGKGYREAEAKHQVSPRIGIAFPISSKGVFHTSYGHFFQIPPYEYLYMNPRFVVAPGGLNTLMGNANLDPQSTVIYEIGFQQELFNQIGIDVTGFYKDIRNLLGTRIYETYVLGDRYARYENRDYGNVRGITLSVNKRPMLNDHLTISFDYTYQMAEGNASDPNHAFYNNQADPPKKSNIQVVPLNWDQRHTVNMAVSYHNPRFIGISLTSQFQSGLPYTPAFQNEESTFQNSGRKPFNYTLDLRIFRQFTFRHMKYNFFIKIYNILDRKNELEVYADTGRAGYSLVSQYVGERQGHVNSLEEWLRQPQFYSEPRKILVGFDVSLDQSQ
ncbi:MAG: TonB-dependent receptor [bacterium]